MPAEPQPEPIPLSVLFEDAHLIVVDKPAGMAAHPAPGSERGTLVNALLAHCGAVPLRHRRRRASRHRAPARQGHLRRDGRRQERRCAPGPLRPVRRARHRARLYRADPRRAAQAQGTIATRIGRSPRDRKKMAVLRSGGREAITHYAIELRFGPPARPWAARVALPRSRPVARTRSVCTWRHWARRAWATRSTAPVHPRRGCERRSPKRG